MGWGALAKEHGFSLRGEENFLNLAVVMVAHICD